MRYRHEFSQLSRCGVSPQPQDTKNIACVNSSVTGEERVSELGVPGNTGKNLHNHRLGDGEVDGLVERCFAHQ